MKSGAAQTGWLKERRLEIASDARVTHGGCLLETPGGLIDGRFESQLTRLHEILSAHYAGSTSR
jgi:flagellar biosynthesis/type III secretory pathway protein FliH